MREQSPIECRLLDALTTVAELRGLHFDVGINEPKVHFEETVRVFEPELLLRRVVSSANSNAFTLVAAPQVRALGYVCDFVVFIEQVSRLAVCVECDGHEWHERTQQQASYDRARDRQLLARLGLPTVRFTGSDIHRDAEACAAELVEIVMHRGPH